MSYDEFDERPHTGREQFDPCQPLDLAQGVGKIPMGCKPKVKKHCCDSTTSCTTNFCT